MTKPGVLPHEDFEAALARGVNGVPAEYQDLVRGAFELLRPHVAAPKRRGPRTHPIVIELAENAERLNASDRSKPIAYFIERVIDDSDLSCLPDGWSLETLREKVTNYSKNHMRQLLEKTAGLISA